MKLIRLFLIALLLQPCPVCWEHGFCGSGQCENDESKKSVPVSTCCSPGTHLHHTHEQNQTDQHKPHHDCPCACHVSDAIYAQPSPSVDVRGITTNLGAIVDIKCQSVQNTVALSSEVSALNLPNSMPLRL